MATGNNRKENTFKNQQPEFEIVEATPSIIEDSDVKKNKKDKNEGQKKEKKTPKDTKPQKPKKEQKESDSRAKRIIGILFICMALFLGIALISYLVSFFSGHHQEWGYQIFSQKVDITNRTGRTGVFLGQTLIKESFGIGSFFFV